MGDGRGGTHIDGVGTIVETSIGEELSGSFLEYAMSVIVSRAIPDVRDGLKPVQRRILYSMWEQGLRSDRQHQKSAKVVGAVMGNYHPHGDCLEGSTEIYAIGGRRWRLDEATNQGLKSLWVWAVTEAGELRAAKAHSFRIGQYATEIYRITLDDGSVIRATANHPFLVATNATGEDGEELEVVEWAKADSLDAGQMLVGGRMEKGAGWTPQRENRIIEAVDVEKLDEAEPMYDFTVDNYENLLIVTSGEAGAERLLVAHNSAIYDAMVRLAQDWVMRVPLVDGQGNFGSPDDSPASSRYTEARLAKAADHLVGDLDENTVDFEPNYDGSTTQPAVLPAKFPNLLVNGANGIAVAMATTIAPHNLREVADGVKLLLAKPQATLGELMKKIPGPDFPTGGVIIGSEGIREAYQTGKGSLRVRGIGHVEELAARRRQIVITELPYGVGPERFIARTAEAVHAKKIDGITGISDHTDRYTGQRIVLTLRAGVNPKAVFAQLYKHTPLEERISLNHVALVDGAPQVVGLKRMLELWVAHAIEVVVRRSQHRLTKAEHRLMLVEGLLKALDMIDEVVATLKRSRNTQTARDNLRKLLKVNEEQANYILEMPLRRLTSLEAKKLRDEAKELKDTIKALKKLLADEKLQREMVATELEEAVGEVGDIERRTKLITAEVEELDGGEVPASVEIADEACVVTLSATGLVGRDQGGRRKPGADDIVVASVEASTRSEVYAVTETGVMYRLAGYETPEAEGRSRGEKAGEVFGLDGGARSREQVVGLFSEKELEAGRIPVFITASGKVKRLDPAQLSKMNAVPVIGLEPGDRLIYAGAATETSDIVFITRGGQVLRTPANKVRPQGRGAAGMAGIGLAEGDVVIGGKAVETGQGSWLVTVVTNGGRVKASALEEHPAKGRATAGVRGIRFLKGEDHLEAAAVVPAAGWAWTDAKNNPLGTTEVAKRDASGEVLEDARGAGAVRANG